MKNAVSISRLFSRLGFVSLCMLAAIGHAEIIICKDASGRTLTSDRPIPECADRAQRVMDQSGIVRREIAAPLTPEQKKKKREDEERLKAQALIDEKEKQNDRALMARFRNEKDIEDARLRSLESVQSDLKRENSVVETAEKDLQKVQKQAALNKGKPALVAESQRRIAEYEKAIKESRIVIQQRELEVAQLNARYDQVLVRFRQLNVNTANAAK